MMFSDTYSKDLSKTFRGGENQSEVNVHTLELSSVPSNISVDDLKRALKVGHLVSLELDTDNLKNINTGKGKLVFRTNTNDDKESVMDKLYEIGIDYKDYVRVNKQKAPRVATSSVGWIDSKNEIDLIKAKAHEREVEEVPVSYSDQKSNSKKRITGKIGENLYIKPSNYLKNVTNDTHEKRINFYESNSDLFGNTNGEYARLHTERVGKEKIDLHKSTKDNRAQHLMANGKVILINRDLDWVKMQKKIDMFATNRATQPKSTRYGKTFNF